MSTIKELPRDLEAELPRAQQNPHSGSLYVLPHDRIHVLRQAEESGIQYPLPDGMSNKELPEKLYPFQTEKPVFKIPDYEYAHKELQKNGVTLKLIWLEY